MKHKPGDLPSLIVSFFFGLKEHGTMELYILDNFCRFYVPFIPFDERLLIFLGGLYGGNRDNDERKYY